MGKSSQRVGIAAALGALVVFVAVLREPPRAHAGAVRVPDRDDEVLERLPTFSEGKRARDLRKARALLASEPGNVALAVHVAEAAIELHRATSDPRFLGQAEAALAPFWSLPDPPPVTLTLRATLRQSQHDFDGALADLDRVIRARPNDPQPYVTRAVVLTVLARYPEARADCTELARRAPPLVSAVCTENVESLTGHASDAYTRLLAASTGGTRLSPAEDAWVASSLGEMAVRAGKAAEGRAHFERALAAEPGDPYVLAALSDLDLDEGEPERVVARLAGKEENDTLLLRLALAEHATGAKDAERHRKLLDDRFRASRLRGDVVHRREESRFTLALLDDPARALVLAVENWAVQREVADARILLEAALAARDPKAAEPVVAWLDSSKCEEPALLALRKALGK